jgi:hypothetical protein
MSPDAVQSEEKGDSAEPLVRKERDKVPMAMDDVTPLVVSAGQQPIGAGENKRKRKDEGNEPFSDDEYEDGNDQDDAEPAIAMLQGGRRKRPVGEKKREIKNAREKERSSRIAKQIDELREILSGCGVIVPKGTKSSVLSEVAAYIRVLQQQQIRSEV